ncbi:MAG: TraR/DksA C4-type zinc finger protein [bacterium]
MSQKHSTGFINEMRTQLETEKIRLEQELSTISSKFPEYGRNEEDNATEIADYQATSATENTLEVRLIGVTAALNRIEQGTYGITEGGDLIPEARLRANPAATTVIK